MKILALSDIHQIDFKWAKLASTVRKKKPDIVTIAGDLILNKFLFNYKDWFNRTILKHLKDINNICPVVLIPGNDDHSDLSDYLNVENGHGVLWHNVDNNPVEIKGFEFIGVPYVLDHPFGYKHWCVRETNENLKINPAQFSKPLTIKNGDNKYTEIEDYALYLMGKPSLETILNEAANKIKNMSKAIMLIHCPPQSCGLDITKYGDICGSFVLAKFLLDKQPLLSLHGHIHESPHYTGKWCCKLDKTWAIQAGQIETDLYYAIIEIEDGKVVGLTHSIYGDMQL